MALTDKKRRFALRYLENGHNATEAAKSAGCPEKSAGTMGSRWLKDVDVAAFLADRLAAAATATERAEEGLELSARRVLEETMRVGYSKITTLLTDSLTLKNPKDWPPDMEQAVASLTIEELFEDQTAIDEATGKPVKIRVLKGYLKKVTLWPKVNALELLGKNLKLWTEMMELSHLNMTPEQKAKRIKELVDGALARAKAQGKLNGGNGAAK